MFANHHHDDSHVAVWLPVPPEMQALLIDEAPDVYFRPPYVGARGWVGIDLDHIDDHALAAHIREAWRMIAPKTLSEGMRQ